MDSGDIPNIRCKNFIYESYSELYNMDNSNIRLDRICRTIPDQFGDVTINNLVYIFQTIKKDFPLLLDEFDNTHERLLEELCI